jgi:hypothetical protein
VPDDIAESKKDNIRRELSRTIRHHVRPLTVSEWSDMLAQAGFEVCGRAATGMHLLEPRRVIRDEGLLGALRILFRIARDRDARRRVFAMHKVFRQYRVHLGAIALIARKPE